MDDTADINVILFGRDAENLMPFNATNFYEQYKAVSAQQTCILFHILHDKYIYK
jgi:hypothetical protein